MQWEQGNLAYKLDSLQMGIRNAVKLSLAKRINILSSRQIGKSYWVGTEALEFLIENPGKIARIVAPTLDQCEDIVNDNLTPILSDAPKGYIERVKSEYRWDFKNGSSLRLGGLKRAHVDSNRGGNASLVIYEECGFVDADDFTYGVNSVLGPQLLRSQGREIFVTSPSEDPDHPLHLEVLPECQEYGTAFQYTVFHSPSISNQAILDAARRTGSLITLDFVVAVRDLPLITIDLIHSLAIVHDCFLSESFRREYMAEIIRSASLMVVPRFNRVKHVSAHIELPRNTPLNVTIDFGGVRDFTVALLHTYDYLTNMDVIWDERSFPPNTPTADIVKELKTWEKQYRIENRWADVPGQTQVDLLTTHNYAMAVPQKSDWLASVNTMANAFTLDRIIIHERCKFLIRTCAGGIFNKNKTDFNRNQKLGHCDALAALMYAIRSQGREEPVREQTPHAYEDNFHFTPKESKMENIASALSPKQFGVFGRRK